MVQLKRQEELTRAIQDRRAKATTENPEKEKQKLATNGSSVSIERGVMPYAVHDELAKRLWNLMQQSALRPDQGVDGLASTYFGATPVATSNSPLASK